MKESAFRFYLPFQPVLMYPVVSREVGGLLPDNQTYRNAPWQADVESRRVLYSGIRGQRLEDGSYTRHIAYALAAAPVSAPFL
jgi:hypothetical protein